MRLARGKCNTGGELQRSNGDLLTILLQRIVGIVEGAAPSETAMRGEACISPAPTTDVPQTDRRSQSYSVGSSTYRESSGNS